MVLLESFKVFSLLPPDELERLRQVTRELSFPAGQQIFREGDRGDGLYLVRSGLVQVLSLVNQSERQVICQLGPGEMFGEMAVLDDQPRSATTVAEEATEVYFVPREPWLEMLRRSPDLSLRMLQEITGRLREFNHQYVRKVVQAERMTVVGRFASAIVHDLKNPLTIISLASDLACQEFATLDNRRICRDRIRKQVDRINSMVAEVLDFTRGGTSRLALAPTQYAVFVKSVVDEVQQEIAIKGVTIKFAEPPPEVKVNINPQRLSRVFWNLLFNAMEAMPDGGKILLRCQVGAGQIVTEIEDSGTGIAPEMFEKLFEAFASYGKPRGTGLGLSIARRIVEEHGGRLYARNLTGGGALFGFTLPVFLSAVSEQPSPTAASQHPRPQPGSTAA